MGREGSWEDRNELPSLPWSTEARTLYRPVRKMTGAARGVAQPTEPTENGYYRHSDGNSGQGQVRLVSSSAGSDPWARSTKAVLLALTSPESLRGSPESRLVAHSGWTGSRGRGGSAKVARPSVSPRSSR